MIWVLEFLFRDDILDEFRDRHCHDSHKVQVEHRVNADDRPEGQGWVVYGHATDRNGTVTEPIGASLAEDP